VWGVVHFCTLVVVFGTKIMKHMERIKINCVFKKIKIVKVIFNQFISNRHLSDDG